MGVAVGDALGLPVQFHSRERCQQRNIMQMLDWALPKGTFSDDTATSLCTLASLKENNWQLNDEDIMKRFVAWLGYGYMTCDGGLLMWEWLPERLSNFTITACL